MKQILQQITKQLKASEIFRSTKFEQVRGTASNGLNGRCAIGVIYSFLGWDGIHPHDENHPELIDRIIGAEQELGLDRSLLSSMVWLNDDQHKSFSEIADYLEEKGL